MQEFLRRRWQTLAKLNFQNIHLAVHDVLDLDCEHVGAYNWHDLVRAGPRRRWGDGVQLRSLARRHPKVALARQSCEW